MKFEDCGDKIKGAWVKVSDAEIRYSSIAYSLAVIADKLSEEGETDEARRYY